MGNKLNYNQNGINNPNYKHGQSYTKLYIVWKGIRQRCNNSNRTDYQYYGGRDITICPEWTNDYTKFRDWALSNGYQEGLEIDREDTDGNYEPNNCRFITKTENLKNQRRIKINLEKANEIRTLYNSRSYTQEQLAEKYNVSQSTISEIIINKRWVI